MKIGSSTQLSAVSFQEFGNNDATSASSAIPTTTAPETSSQFSETLRHSSYHVASNINIDVIDVRYDVINGQTEYMLVSEVRSKIECSMRCFSEKMFVCRGFEHDDSSGECSLVSAFKSGVNRSESSTTRYRLKEDCPPDTIYFSALKSCLKLISNSFSWYEARRECLKENFHPLIIDEAQYLLADVKTFVWKLLSFFPAHKLLYVDFYLFSLFVKRLFEKLAKKNLSRRNFNR
ncbi:hypothetical protein HELRODRAFT_183418 [Helobdella robusta]|uniref:Uncharacterized protein n=1 Tax=Helobdella robusta TaxID=6412 RepID=T1FJL9_HELRO|nr:hypothetical protein HELRODRAFT_183418 [Helobdella robusta]ESO11178.1 hypothetical protein HELRODRAFT_183418 [Helobdella robusta]